MKNDEIALTIKQRITMPQVIEMYLGTGSNRGRIPCPFHNGEHPNFGYNNEVFHCFTCGVSGDIFSFVELRFGLCFRSAAKMLNDDFGLNLPISHKATWRERYEITERMKAWKAEKEEENKRKREKDEHWKRLMECEEIIKRKQAENADPFDDEEFSKALKDRALYEYLSDADMGVN